jgi:predicted Zn-dependent peptidase
MDFKIKQVELKSGARLVHVVAKNLPYSVVSFWVRAGSRFDPEGKEGLSHFFEHLWMQSTSLHPDRVMRMTALESAGIYFNAFTEHESARFFHIQPTDKTRESLEMLLDGVNTSFIDPNRLKEEREVIMQEERRNRANPEQYLWRLSQQTLFSGTKLGRSLFGDAHTLAAITMEDLDLFQKKYYVAVNTVFVVISEEKTSQLKKMIDKKLTIPKGEAPKASSVRSKSKSQVYGNQSQDAVTIGINIRTEGVNDPESIPFSDLFREYFSGRWIARLNRALRLDRQLTYWVDGVSEYFSDVGYTRFSYTTSGNNVKKSIEIAQKEIMLAAQSPILEEVFAAVKASYLSDLLRRLQEPEYLLWWIGSKALFTKDLYTPRSYAALVNKITAKDFQKYLKTLLDGQNLISVCIGKDIKQG